MTMDFDPYSVTLILTGDPNFFLAKSSDGYSVYGVVFEGRGRVSCSCEGFAHGYNCKHRRAAVARFDYVSELDEVMSDGEWARVKARMELAEDAKMISYLESQAA